jgi:hypothetical protein
VLEFTEGRNGLSVSAAVACIRGAESPPHASKRPASGNGLIQKKKKRDKYRAAEQDRPVPYIETKKASIRWTGNQLRQELFGPFSAMREVVRAM